MWETAARAFLSVLFQKLFEKLAELRTNSVASKLKTLEEKLEKVKLYLDDAEDRQLFEKKVKEWLDELKHVIFMADDLVEEIYNSKNEKKFKRKDVTTAIKSLYHSVPKNFQDDIGLIFDELDSLYYRAYDLELKHIRSCVDLSRRSSPVAPLREEHHVYGRDAEKEEILKVLLSEEDKMIVLPIVGMGGLGKTTLAQLLYDDKRVGQHGFLKAWVTVSTEFDFCRIMKELLQKVDPEEGSSKVNDTNELQRRMKEAVRGKRFLFVLDDFWDENLNNWDLLKTNFAAGGPGSRVIVTSRSRVVGSRMNPERIHQLKEVEEDDSWSIFVHHAFDGATNAGLELQEMGRRIVKKCKGLPLAVKSIGSLLRPERDPRKWENILESQVWSQKNLESGVLPSLWLSYRYLSSSLKQCFAYCSVLPQDYKFQKRQRILWWMAEGFICSNEEGKSMKEVGEEYFDDLVSRSLFQRSSEDDDKYLVHDLVHDLAAFVYGNFCLRIEDENLKNVTIRTRHLIYNRYVSCDDLLTSLSISKHLRTLMDIHQYSFHENVHDFLKEAVLKVKCLRVVYLCLKSSMLHNSLGDLKMLRYLNLSYSNIEELPDSICSLFHLQTLILLGCSNLLRLPMDLPRKLSKLRFLDTIGTILVGMPPKMGSLKDLRILTNFVVGEGDESGCSTFKDLGELHHLGELCISKLVNVDNVEDVEKANLIDKADMKELNLHWEDYDRGYMREKALDVLNALQPHKNMETLGIINYPGSSFPKWVGERSFSKMVNVRLYGGRTSVLPPFGQLPSLRVLFISGFYLVEKIGKELLYGSDTNSTIIPFPSLEQLEFNHMQRWKEWSFVGNNSGCFPRLKELTIRNCRELECIINREDEDEDQDERAEMESTTLHHHCPSLSLLKIIECPLLERRYQKDKGDHWHYISHIPHIHIDGPTTDKLKWKEEEKRRGEEDSASQNT